MQLLVALPSPLVPPIFFVDKEAIVQLLTGDQKRLKSPIPVIGLESKPESNSADKCAPIALCAYYKAEARGCDSGHELEDWLEAEAEIQAEAGKCK